MKPDAVDKILGQWRRERPELDVSPMGVMGRIARLSKHLDRSIRVTVSEFGLNLGEFDVLATLRRSGHPYQLSPTDLYQSMMISSGTMTHRLDRLEKSALVERIPDPSDRRGMLIQLTEKGFNLIEKAVEAHVSNGHRLLDSLERSERVVLADLLHKLLIAFEE